MMPFTDLHCLPPLSLYVHIPWCIKKCPYCDFNSHAISSHRFDDQAYVRTLLQDLFIALPSINNRPIVSIFIGGGTPSLLSYQALERLLLGIQKYCHLIPDIEITVEANPGTVDQSHFQRFAQAGVTRLSLGIQSFSDRCLQSLGRIHDSRAAHRAVDCALSYFKQVNIDLMYALPHQTITEALLDINVALASGVSHISAYQLTIEPHTLFSLAPPKDLPNHDQSDAIAQAIHRQLRLAKFAHYEISAFAQHHHYCQHNLNYWQFGDYVGIGAGAHSKLTTKHGVLRTMRYQHPQTYAKQVSNKTPIQSQHCIAPSQLKIEFMMNALRLTAGFAPALFTQRTGLPFSALSRALDQAKQQGLVVVHSNLIKTSARGRRFLNDLLLLFMSSSP